MPLFPNFQLIKFHRTHVKYVMKDYEEKYPIGIIPDTYYRVNHTFSFFSNKETIEHCFIIKGNKVSLGTYDNRKRTLLYTGLCDFLGNRHMLLPATSQRKALQNTNSKFFLDLIDGYNITQCLEDILSFSFKAIEDEEKYIQNVGYVREASINVQKRANDSYMSDAHYFRIDGAKIYINGDFYKSIGIDDTILIITYLKISFLAKFQKWDYNSDFRFNKNSACIETALRRGWISENSSL